MAIKFNDNENKKKIQKILKEIRGESENKQLYNKTENLFQKLYATRKETGMQIYHSNRFSFIKEGSYFSTSKAKLNIINKKKMNELYRDIKTIFQKIGSNFNQEMFNNDLNYAVYYTYRDKTVKRFSTNQIPYKNIKKDKNTGNLFASSLKSYVHNLEKQQKQDNNIINVGVHFDSFVGAIQGMYTGKSNIPNNTISYGRLAEAFQRHLQSNLEHDMNDAPPWDANEIWRDIKLSIGNVPWYLMGDVNLTQVKSVIGSTTQIKLISIDSLQDILNFFKYIKDSDEIDDQMINNTYKVLKEQIEDQEEEVKKMTAEEIMNYFKKLQQGEKNNS